MFGFHSIASLLGSKELRVRNSDIASSQSVLFAKNCFACKECLGGVNSELGLPDMTSGVNMDLRFALSF